MARSHLIRRPHSTRRSPHALRRQAAEALAGAFPLWFLAVILLIRATAFDLYQVLISEDGVFESLQVVAYLISSGWFFLRGWTTPSSPRWGRWLLWVISGGLFLWAMEEMSWGQRLIGFTNTSFFAAYNVQGETSIHNLIFIQKYLHWGYVAVGLGLGVACPTVVALSSHHLARRFLPSFKLAGYFLPLSLVYATLIAFPPPLALRGFSSLGMIWRDQEGVELLLALGLVAWAGTMRSRQSE